MLVIRRMVDRHRAYTAMFLPGEPPRIFPTTDQEHARILQIYRQDRRYEGIVNDFSEDEGHMLPPDCHADLTDKIAFRRAGPTA